MRLVMTRKQTGSSLHVRQWQRAMSTLKRDRNEANYAGEENDDYDRPILRIDLFFADIHLQGGPAPGRGRRSLGRFETFETTVRRSITAPKSRKPVRALVGARRFVENYRHGGSFAVFRSRIVTVCPVARNLTVAVAVREPQFADSSIRTVGLSWS